MIRLKPIQDLSRYGPSIENKAGIPIKASVTADGEVLEVIGPILAFRSPVFESQLLHSSTVFVAEFRIHDVMPCLDILYGKEVTLDERNINYIYIFGSRYQIGEMCFTVEDFIEHKMDVNDFWKYLLVAKDYFGITNLEPYFKTRADRSIEKDYVDFYHDCQVAIKEYCKDDRDRGYLVQFVVTNLDISYLNVSTDFITDVDNITAKEETGIDLPVYALLSAYETVIREDRLSSVNIDVDIFVRLFNLLNCKMACLEQGRRFARIRKALLKVMPVDRDSSRPDYNILTKKLVNFCSRSKTTEETILEFSRQSILPAYVVIEICLKWIALHRNVPHDSVKDMFEKASHLFVYYSLTTFQLKRFTRKPLTFYNIHPCDRDSMYIECQWHLYDPNSNNSMFKERPTIEDLKHGISTDDVMCWRHGKGCSHETSTVGVTENCVFCCHFKNNDGTWYHCRSNRTPINFTFKYMPQSTPQYEEQDHNEHWYLMCMYQDGKCYMYSFICGKQVELEELLRNSSWVKLHCVYRELS